MLQLEIGWTILPFVLSMVIFYWGAVLFIDLRRPPADSLEVFAVGKRWMWKMQHLEGRREINELHVPIGQPVKVTLTSEDVIHSFFVPAFRVKQDAVPGRYTDLWFEATKPGRYHLFCAEFCGSQHARMIGQVIAMEPADFQAWLSGTERGAAPVSMAEAGKQLFTDLGCVTCHQTDDSGRGPSLVGVAGSAVELSDGSSVVADSAYLRESILRPQQRVTAGYQPIMPTHQGLVGEDQVLELIAYIESLRDRGSTPPGEVTPRTTEAATEGTAG
jgi:cytochrome c oxidase subunit 2